MKTLVVLLALGGCDAVFSLEHVTNHSVTGTYAWDYVMTTPAGPVPVEAPAPSGNESVAVGLDDLSTQSVTLGADGSFAFDYSGDAYRLVMQDDTGIAIEYQSTSPTVAVRREFSDRVDGRVGLAVSTPIAFHLTGTIAGGTARVTSTGFRTSTAPDVGTDAADPTLDWLHAGVEDGSLSLLDATMGDLLYYVHFVHVAPAYTTLAEYDVEAITMTAGAPVTIGPKVVTPLPQGQCVHLITPRATELQRVIADTGIADPTPASAWDIYSIPNVLAPVGLLQLVSDAVGVPTDEDEQVVFGALYPGETLVASLAVSLHETYTLPGRLPSVVYVPNTTYFDLVPTASSPCPDTTVSLATQPVALVTAVSVAGAALTTQNQTVMIDRSGLVAVELTFGDGAKDDLSANLYELTASAANVTTLREIRTFVTTGTKLAIDPALLVSGRTYAFELDTRLGYPAAAQVDYRAVAYPYATGRVYSIAFTIGP